MTTDTLNAEKYYVATKPQTNNVHSVHREGCPFMPDVGKRIFLGLFTSGNQAGEESRKYFDNSHGCRFCAKESFAGEERSHAEFVPSGISHAMEFLN